MLSAYRIVKTRYAGTAWDGQAAARYGGRWNSAGVRVVYAASSVSLALVEVLVHLPSQLLGSFSAVRADFDESLVSVLSGKDVPDGFQDDPPPAATKAIGDAWIRSARSAVLSVPSAVVPDERNYLFNPRHRDFARVKIGKPRRFPLDQRLVKR